MKVIEIDDVPSEEIKGFKGVRKQIVIGPSEGSNEIVLRCFSIDPGSSSPYHTHDFPHLIKVESGEGFLKDADGKNVNLRAGQYVYIDDNEKHSITNTCSETLRFICIVPIRGENPS